MRWRLINERISGFRRWRVEYRLKKTVVNLEVSLPSSGPPAGRVLDVTGRTVAALEFAHAGSSQYHACWSCSDASPGVYFAVAESEGNRICSPVLVLR